MLERLRQGLAAQPDLVDGVQPKRPCLKIKIRTIPKAALRLSCRPHVQENHVYTRINTKEEYTNIL